MCRGRTIGLLATLALAVGFVAACGQPGQTTARERTLATDPPKTKRAAGVAPEFVGTEWSLTSLRGENLLDGTSITLEIDRDAGRIEVGGTSTCNFYDLGKPTMKDGVLKSRGVGTTEIGCPGERGRQEQAYIAALEDAATYRLSDDTLKVQDAAGKTTLVYRREPLAVSDPADLVGTRWVLRSIGGRAVAEGFTASVSFDSARRVSGYDGCRHFTGRYYADENDLTVPEFGYDVEEDCLKPGAYGRGGPVRALENMPLEGNYSLDRGRLEVRDDSGTVSVYGSLREGAEVERAGPAWVLEKFIEEGEATPVLDGTEITLRFDRGTLRSSGMMGGSAGCNYYGLPYEHPIARNGPDRLEVGNPSVTKKMCPFPSGVMQQERRYLEILADVSSYPSITVDGRMRLKTDDGRALVFRAPG